MIRTKKAHLPVATITHEGKRGKNNEDRYAVSSFRLNLSQGGHPVLLAVVSDGVGGHRAGEVASEMTVNAISQSVRQSDGANPQGILTQAIHNVSNQIFALGRTTGDFEGMGSTVACVLIIGHRLYTATVGDSRIYLMHNGQFRQVSTDHTWVQEALDAGIIQPSEVAHHPNQHVIRRYLGSPKPPEVDFRICLNDHEDDLSALNRQGLVLHKGDRLLLCTDGLSDLVSADEMGGALNRQPSEQALQTLVDLANSRGGHDNITITAIEVPGDAPLSEKYLTPRLVSALAYSLMGISALVLMLAAGWLVKTLFQSIQGVSTIPTSTFKIIVPITSQELTAHPLPTFTLDPAISFDRLMTPSLTATSLFHQPQPGESTMTPWPTNTFESPSKTQPTLEVAP